MVRKRAEAATYSALKHTLQRYDQREQFYQNVLASTEAMLRYLVVHSPHTALMLVESNCWRSARRTYEAHRVVARHYGVPWFDFLRALDHSIEPVRPLRQKTKHPGRIPT